MNRRNRIDSKIRDFFGSDPKKSVPNNSDRKPATIDPILVSTSPTISKPQIETKTDSFEKKVFFCFFEEKKFLKISAMRSKNVSGPAFSFLGQTKLLRNFRRRVLRKRQSLDGRIVSQFRIGQLLTTQITL